MFLEKGTTNSEGRTNNQVIGLTNKNVPRNPNPYVFPTLKTTTDVKNLDTILVPV